MLCHKVVQSARTKVHVHAGIIIDEVFDEAEVIGLSRSNLRMGPFKRLGIVQSMPMLSTNPRVLKLQSNVQCLQKLLMQKLG